MAERNAAASLSECQRELRTATRSKPAFTVPAPTPAPAPARRPVTDGVSSSAHDAENTVEFLRSMGFNPKMDFGAKKWTQPSETSESRTQANTYEERTQREKTGADSAGADAQSSLSAQGNLHSFGIAKPTQPRNGHGRHAKVADPAGSRTTASPSGASTSLFGSNPSRLPRRILTVFLICAGVATVLGLGLLWPSDADPEVRPGFADTQSVAAQSVKGTVVEHSTGGCGSTDVGRVIATTKALPGLQGPVQCGRDVVKLEEGNDAGKFTLLEFSGQPGEPTLATGDGIELAIHTSPGMPATYSFLDIDRMSTVWLWLALAVIAVVGVGLWRGVRSLLGLGLTLLTVVGFLIPGLLHGGSPIALALVTGAAVVIPTLFLVHGRNWKSASALAGTLITLGLSAVLAQWSISSAQLRGLGNEDNLLIQLYLPQVEVTGLMMAGFTIGALGVLNDVTIAQASTVRELYDASPNARPRSVFASAMRVGQDHIASMVYTLVLAYLGTSLPMVLLLGAADRPLTQILNSDVVATELLRSSIGAIALVLAVPITTAIAAWTVRDQATVAAPAE